MNTHAVRASNEIVFVADNWEDCYEVREALIRHHIKELHSGWGGNPNAYYKPAKEIQLVSIFNCTSQWSNQIDNWVLTIENEQELFSALVVEMLRIIDSRKTLQGCVSRLRADILGVYSRVNAKAYRLRDRIGVCSVPAVQLKIMAKVMIIIALEHLQEMNKFDYRKVQNEITKVKKELNTTVCRTRVNQNIGLPLYDEQPFIDL